MSTPVTETGASAWDNIEVVGFESDRTVQKGNTVQISAVWEDNGNKDATITLGLDTDTNPYNPITGSAFYSGSAGGAANGQITKTLDTSIWSTGSYYVYAKISNGTRTRYYYARGKLTISTQPDTTPPGNITNFTATAGDARVDLSWKKPSDSDLSGILIVRRAGAQPSSGPINAVSYAVGNSLGGGTVIYASNGTSHADTGLTNGTTYYYKAYAFDTSKNYASGVSANATPQQPTPTAPSNLTATPVSGTQINLSWSDNSNNESGFKIERSPDGNSWSEITTVGANVMAFSDTNLATCTAYHYRARAYNNVGNSDYSNSAETTTWCADLVIESTTVTPSAGYPGTAATVTLTIKNIGSLAANNFHLAAWWGLLPNPSEYDCNEPNSLVVSGSITVPLAVGESRSLSYSITLPGSVGDHALYAFVDSRCEIKEQNEGWYNSKGRLVKVWTSDLAVTGMTITSTSGKPGDAVTITATVKNWGPLVVDDIPVHFFTDNDFCGGNGVHTGTISSLGVNQSVTISFSTKFRGVGTMTARALARDWRDWRYRYEPDYVDNWQAYGCLQYPPNNVGSVTYSVNLPPCSDGVLAWGDVALLGDGEFPPLYAPVVVSNLSNVTGVAASLVYEIVNSFRVFTRRAFQVLGARGGRSIASSCSSSESVGDVGCTPQSAPATCAPVAPLQ